MALQLVLEEENGSREEVMKKSRNGVKMKKEVE